MGSGHRASIQVRIGVDLGVEVIDGSGAALLPDDSALQAFLGDGPTSLTLEVTRGRLPRLELGDAVFDSEGRWKVFRDGGDHVLELFAAGSPEPYSVAVIDFERGRGRVFVSAPPEDLAYPFFYPLDEIVFSKLLADRGGFIAHACGLDIDGRGLLLPGHSGAGKSTLAELFTAVPGVRVLSDDRVAVQVRDGGLTLSGTPWHGTSTIALPESVPLEQVLFLSHGDRNRHRALSPGRAAARLLALSVLPGWDRPALEGTLAACERIAGARPVGELEFVPDGTAVAYLVERLRRK